MHVAINALFLQPPMGGLELYLRRLVPALLERSDAPQLTIYLNPAGHGKLTGEAWANDVRLVRAERLGRSGARALSEAFALGPVADKAGADVIHSVAMTGPLISRAARVVTIADTTWLTNPTAGSLTHALWRRLIPLVARRSDEVIAISGHARDEIVRHLGVDPARIHLTTLGSGSQPGDHPTPAPELRERLALGPGPIVLNVGQRGTHRNLERLVDALGQVRREVPEAQLVLPGYSSPELDGPLRDRAATLGIGDAVQFPGFVTDEDLDGLYRAADAFVMPSLTEGFGLPVLEALQRGTPVACTRDSAPSEVAGDAAITFDATSSTDIAASILRLLSDEALRQQLAEAGPQRAAEFSWEDCAARTIDVYQRALA